MVRPVCVPCMKEFKPLKNGVVVEDVADRLWAADLWECQGCGAQVITGFSREPVAASWQGPAYENVRVRSMGRVES